MIKETHLNINIVGRNLSYYKYLGYDAIVGQKLLVKVEDIQKNSHIRITAICDNCDNENNISLYAYNKNKKSGNVYYCDCCKQLKIEKTNLEKYNVKRPIQNKEIYEKLKKSNNEKFGVSI
ncbi:hypothetical protein M0Q97_12845, partial [Candidatus Dojkabacteria bacterium]|nr:hypothetical protein [Candidatus Dojkabacteria bacterium]